MSLSPEASFIIALGLTVAFSFVPERWLKPKKPSLETNTVILQTLLVSLLFIAVTIIVQRPIFAALAVSIFLIILSGVSNAKFHALKEPMVFSDISMFSQAFKHPRLYFPFLGFAPVIIAPIVIIALIYIVLTLEPALPFTWQRIGFSIFAIAVCFAGAKTFAKTLQLCEDPTLDNARFGLLNSLFSYTVQASSNSHKQQILDNLKSSSFAKTLKQIDKKTPPHFYEVSTKPHPSGGRRSAPTLSRRSLGLGISSKLPQHITVIQSESFFDARRLSDSINSNVLENYDACLKDSIQHGKLKVPAWGANTMRTEFSFLTGLDYQDMGLYRYYPYQYLHKTPLVSVAKLLQVQGYYCVCIHPHSASFFGRDRIFPQLGFDEFIDIKDFDTSHTFGPYISDQAVTDKILEIDNKYGDKPLFIFAITMENHGPLHLEKIVDDEQQSYFKSRPIKEINDLSVYLRHLKNADKMIQNLTTSYVKSEQPQCLCFYGDHIPSMPNIYQQLNYTGKDSDYFIWHNQTDSLSKNKGSNSDLSVAYLAETLLKQMPNVSV